MLFFFLEMFDGLVMLRMLFGFDGPHPPSVLRLLEASIGSVVGVRFAILLLVVVRL